LTSSSPEVLVRDALDRRESCGGHFREEFQTEDGEAQRERCSIQLRERLGICR
jgi:succinate dehydrogenase / fumarate reductase flavoprotein subunit